jgi:hypothetical protein
LDCETTGSDTILGKAKLGERSTGRDLDLRSNDIDTRDLFSDGMLDLTA